MEERWITVKKEAAGVWEFAKAEALDCWEIVKEEARDCWDDLGESTIVTKRELVFGAAACVALGVLLGMTRKPKQIIVEVPAEAAAEEEEEEVK